MASIIPLQLFFVVIFVLITFPGRGLSAPATATTEETFKMAVEFWLKNQCTFPALSTFQVNALVQSPVLEICRKQTSDQVLNILCKQFFQISEALCSDNVTSFQKHYLQEDAIDKLVHNQSWDVCSKAMSNGFVDFRYLNNGEHCQQHCVNNRETAPVCRLLVAAVTNYGTALVAESGETSDKENDEPGVKKSSNKTISDEIKNQNQNITGNKTTQTESSSNTNAGLRTETDKKTMEQGDSTIESTGNEKLDGSNKIITTQTESQESKLDLKDRLDHEMKSDGTQNDGDIKTTPEPYKTEPIDKDDKRKLIPSEDETNPKIKSDGSRNEGNNRASPTDSTPVTENKDSKSFDQSTSKHETTGDGTNSNTNNTVTYDQSGNQAGKTGNEKPHEIADNDKKKITNGGKSAGNATKEGDGSSNNAESKNKHDIESVGGAGTGHNGQSQLNIVTTKTVLENVMTGKTEHKDLTNNSTTTTTTTTRTTTTTTTEPTTAELNEDLTSGSIDLSRTEEGQEDKDEGRQQVSSDPDIQHSPPRQLEVPVGRPVGINMEEDEPPSGHFMAYFLTACVMCVAGYVVYHNKKKIMAFILEGRREAQQRRRTSGSGSGSGSLTKYHKLQPSVEEVMPSLEKSTTAKDYIY